MKSPQRTFSQFESLANRWLRELDTYTEEQFLRKPSEHEWSIGQVYMHLFQSAKFFHLKQIEQCAAQQGTVTNGEKKMPGKISFMLGMFLPVRIKVPPSPQYTPPQPKNKEEATTKLNKIIIDVKNILPAVEHASLENKTAHPALGYLNAREWYQLISMHFHHHLRQKARLDKFLGIQK